MTAPTGRPWPVLEQSLSEAIRCFNFSICEPEKKTFLTRLTPIDAQCSRKKKRRFTRFVGELWIDPIVSLLMCRPNFWVLGRNCARTGQNKDGFIDLAATEKARETRSAGALFKRHTPRLLLFTFISTRHIGGMHPRPRPRPFTPTRAPCYAPWIIIIVRFLHLFHNVTFYIPLSNWVSIKRADYRQSVLFIFPDRSNQTVYQRWERSI